MSPPSNAACFLFAGPTLAVGKTTPVPDDICVLRPAARGDIQSLVSRVAPSSLALADGYFHQALSVGHAELRDAIGRGWRVWGLSSLGAIRAYEMRDFGMLGYGAVYEMFCNSEDFRDDEVALLHASDPPYRPISEPLVHLRAALQYLQMHGIVTPQLARDAEVWLMSIWYGDRTLPALVRFLTTASTSEQAAHVAECLADFDRFRVKGQDLARFVREAPWRRQ